MHRARLIAALLGIALVAGCGGAGGSSALPGTGAPVRSGQTVSVAFRIAIPQRTSQRRPQYVSSSTQSATIAVTPSGGTAGAPATVNCTTVCSGTIDAPPGSDTFTIALYDAQNGTGNVLSTGSLTQTIVIDQANSVNVTFNGVVASMAVSFSGKATAGVPGSFSLSVDAYDADGNVIVGPGRYVDARGNPLTIALTTSDTTGAMQLSQPSITQPTTGLTIAYNGFAIVPATITASATGVPNATTLFKPALQPIGPGSLSGGIYLNAFGASSPQSFTLSETGWSDAPYNKNFTATMSGCGSIATISPSSGTTFAVTLVASPVNSSCTLTFTDGAGQSLVIPIGYEAYAYTGTLATFTAPQNVTSVNITAIGAGGGGGGVAQSGGAGASESGTFSVSPGTSYSVLVGGTGTVAANGAAGGGGGSFVFVSGAGAPLIAAGGGGGAGIAGTNGAGLAATPAANGIDGANTGGTGGSSGNGGGCTVNSGGGAGFIGDGTACNGVGAGTNISVGGGAGGTSTFANGGFGGGGAASAPGGGGGGYSGGGAGGVIPLPGGGGGGGGSFNAGTNTSSGIGAASAHNGSIVITW